MADKTGDKLEGWEKLRRLAAEDPDIAAAMDADTESFGAMGRDNAVQACRIAKLRRDRRGLKRELRRVLAERDAETGVTCGCDAGVTATGVAPPVWCVTVSVVGVDGVTIMPWVAEG